METDYNFVFYVIRDRKSGHFVKKTARDPGLTPKIGQARIFSSYKQAKIGYEPRMYTEYDMYIQVMYANISPNEEMAE